MNGDGARNRWFGVGHSDAPNPGVACAEAAVEAIQGREPTILFVLTSLRADFAPIVAAARASAGPGTTIVGGTTFGEITPAGVSEAGVTVIALGGSGITVKTAISRDAMGRQRQAGIEVASAVGRTDRAHQVLLMIPDGGLDQQHEIVRGAYSVVGAGVPMAGGCTADPGTLKTHQFYGDHSGVEVLSGSVIAVLIGSDGPIGIGMAHGWRRTGEPMSLTRSEETRIYEFDHEPALDVYLRRVGADPSTAADLHAVGAVANYHPFGLARRSGEDIRIIYSVDPTDRSMTCFADVPQGALVWLMETDRQSLIDSGRQSCLQAVAGLEKAQPIGVVVFNCGVRKIILEEDVCKEIAKIVESAQGAAVAGYYSMGEVARIRGARGMHHLTSVAVAFG